MIHSSKEPDEIIKRNGLFPGETVMMHFEPGGIEAHLIQWNGSTWNILEIIMDTAPRHARMEGTHEIPLDEGDLTLTVQFDRTSIWQPGTIPGSGWWSHDDANYAYFMLDHNEPDGEDEREYTLDELKQFFDEDTEAHINQAIENAIEQE